MAIPPGSNAACPGGQRWLAEAAGRLQGLILVSSCHIFLSSCHILVVLMSRPCCPHVLVSLTHCCSRKYFSKKWGTEAEQGSGVSSLPRASGALGCLGWHRVLDPAAGMGWESQTWRSLEIRLWAKGSRNAESAAPASPPAPWCCMEPASLSRCHPRAMGTAGLGTTSEFLRNQR